jgi:parvulin-like peptidyl-prolyl isomerase
MKKNIMWIAVAMIILVAVVALIYTGTSTVKDAGTKDVSKTVAPDIQDTQSVQETSYVSHGQNVPGAVVEQKFAALDSKLNITKQQVADAIVSEKILITKAEEKNITVSDDEVDNFIEQTLTQYSISREEYSQRLEAAGLTEEQYKEQLRDQIKIAKLINDSIKKEDYAVSDAEVDAFMQEHKADYESLDSGMLSLIRQRIKNQMIEKKKTDLLNAYIEKVGG